MKPFKTLFIMVGIISGIICVFFVFIMSRYSNESFYESYVAKNNGNSIVYEYNDEKTTIILRWIEENIKEGPYYLFLSVDVKDDFVENIYIKDISIDSSTGKEYKFISIEPKPFLIYNIDKKDTHLEYDEDNDRKRLYQFDDNFDFDFDNKEKFTLNITLRYEGENIQDEKSIQIDYIPYLDKVYVPFL